MPKKSASPTHVDRLKKAGLIHGRQRLDKSHAARINRLSKAEVATLVRVVKKVGRKKSPRGVSRAWIV